MPRRRIGIALGIRVAQVQHAALGHHGIVVEVLFQPFPQFHRQFIEGFIAVEQVIGADDRGVAPDIAAADPAFFQDRNSRICRSSLAR